MAPWFLQHKRQVKGKLRMHGCSEHCRMAFGSIKIVPWNQWNPWNVKYLPISELFHCYCWLPQILLADSRAGWPHGDGERGRGSATLQKSFEIRPGMQISGFGIAVSALANAGALELAMQRLDDMRQLGFSPATCSCLEDFRSWNCLYSQLLHSASSLEHGISSWTKQEIQKTMKWGEHKNAWMMDMDGFCALQGMYCSYLMLFESIYYIIYLVLLRVIYHMWHKFWSKLRACWFVCLSSGSQANKRGLEAC